MRDVTQSGECLVLLKRLCVLSHFQIPVEGRLEQGGSEGKISHFPGKGIFHVHWNVRITI